MSERTADDIDKANRYHTILRGFRDGVSAPAYRVPDDHPLHALYMEAYANGRRAGNSAALEATTATGYRPSPFRGAHDRE